MIRGIFLAIGLLLAVPALAQNTNTLPAGIEGDSKDPTQNVLNTLRDGRAADTELFNRLLEAFEKLMDEKVKRLDQLRDAEARSIDRLMAAAALDRNNLLEAAEKLSETQFASLVKQAELDREAFAEANRAAVETAKGLALSQQQSAEVLSGQVVTAQETATANQERLEERTVASQNATNARLGEIERSLSVLAGRSGVTDPAFDRLAVSVEALLAAQSSSAGRGSGQSDLWALIGGGILLFFGLVSMVIGAVTFSRRSDHREAPTVRRAGE